jgi:hypothetical protein
MSNDSTVPLAAPDATSTAITFYHCQLTGLPSQVTGKKAGDIRVTPYPQG